MNSKRLSIEQIKKIRRIIESQEYGLFFYFCYGVTQFEVHPLYYQEKVDRMEDMKSFLPERFVDLLDNIRFESLLEKLDRMEMF